MIALLNAPLFRRTDRQPLSSGAKCNPLRH
jgi:hypothetical protein